MKIGKNSYLFFQRKRRKKRRRSEFTLKKKNLRFKVMVALGSKGDLLS
jgi:hypothetical protein